LVKFTWSLGTIIGLAVLILCCGLLVFGGITPKILVIFIGLLGLAVATS
jgi:hypothetical protein